MRLERPALQPRIEHGAVGGVGPATLEARIADGQENTALVSRLIPNNPLLHPHPGERDPNEIGRRLIDRFGE